MAKRHIKKNKSPKKKLSEAIYSRLDMALSEYNDYLDSKKISGELKRTSKLLAKRIEKKIMKSKEQQRKLEKKAANLYKKKEQEK
jgi:predicted ATPase with chaperone activity